MIRIVIVAVVLFIVGCGERASKKVDMNRGDQYESNNKNYNFDTPSRSFSLPQELIEISGLDFDGKDLIAVNDEQGSLFKLDHKTGKVNEVIHFGSDGDYEGVEAVKGDVFILKSNGDLNIFDTKSKNNKIVTTSFSKDNNMEGLAYNKLTNKLLLVTKKKGLDTSNKAIYSYDISQQKLNEDPLIEIDPSDLWSFVKRNNKVLSKNERKELKKRVNSFSPSGISVDNDGHYYIISARGSVICEYSSEKRLKNVSLLDDLLLPQPEGITFDNNQNLYISTEGKNRAAEIYIFEKK